MEEYWRSQSRLLAALITCCLYLLNLSFCSSLNDEGVALLRFKEKVVSDPHGALSNWKAEAGIEVPCSWFGIGCSEGYVVVLNLKDLSLRGTLAPDIGKLIHVKSILLDNNEFLDRTHREIHELQKLSEVQFKENLLSTATRRSTCNGLLISWNSEEKENVAQRKLLQQPPERRPGWRFLPPPPPEFRILNAPPPPAFQLTPPSPDPFFDPSLSPPPPSPSPSPFPSVSPSPVLVAPSPLPSPETHDAPPSFTTPAERPRAPSASSRSRHGPLILAASIGGCLLLLLLIGGFLFCQCSKMATVKPWATGLSGQLQKAFVTGVPKLKRSELVAACEDFSNVIGSSSVCTLYKGTLSNGVEIAVASIPVESSKEWSNRMEAHFRKKIDTLSKVNHKNFVNLLGYCVEEEPSTRMMVFEYAPNGTLFEHLHIREAEHLDWAMRLRIAMGIAYCLEYMHQLTPALAHRNLTSSSVYLTEDYAGKVSDFVYGDEGHADEIEPNTESNVYSFGVVLFEMITGRLPYSIGGESLENWASDYLRVQPPREIVDPTLRTYGEDQLQEIGSVIILCTNADPRRRPSMKEVCVMLRQITGIGPDGAMPKLSPLWWAELEILSTEAN